MDWNSFNKELQNRVSDPGVRVILGIIYERLLDTTRQVDENNEILLQLVETMKDLVGVSELVDNRVKELRRAITGRTDGVSLESVPLTNDE
jgi:hypothetical protein